MRGRDERSLRSLRGRVVSYVPQDPGGALNPSLRVGDAILDVLRAHRAGEGSPESVHAALDRVELGGDAGFTRRYPHQLSGGQQQRVTIAMACVCEPPVAVLDEPTTGLDVLTQDRILFELDRLRSEQGMAMVYVSHDLAVVARMADRIVVMYAGRVVENAPAADVIERPRHPVHARARGGDPRLPRTRARCEASPASRSAWASGRRAAPSRRAASTPAERCDEAVPALADAAPGHAVRCCRAHEIAARRASREHAARAAAPTPRPRRCSRCHGLEARYRSGRTARPAVVDVSFAIPPGRCVALVGESGSGKTTVGRCIAGLHRPSGGSILFDGELADRRRAPRARSTCAAASRSCSRTRSSRSTPATRCAARSRGRCACCRRLSRRDADAAGRRAARARAAAASAWPSASRSSSRAASASAWRSRARWRPSPTC